MFGKAINMDAGFAAIPLTSTMPLRRLLPVTAGVTEFIHPCRAMAPKSKSYFLSLAAADMLFPEKELSKLNQV